MRAHASDLDQISAPMTVLQIDWDPGILIKPESKTRIAVIHIQIQTFLRQLMVIHVSKQTICRDEIILPIMSSPKSLIFQAFL